MVHVTDDSDQLVEEQVLGQRHNLGNVVIYVLSHIQARHWKRVGLALAWRSSHLMSNNSHMTMIVIWRPLLVGA